MKGKRVLVLVHQDLVPPQDFKIKKQAERDECDFITEFDVISTLNSLGHKVEVLGIYSDLKPIREKIDDFKPHIVFNLMEEFAGEPLYDQNVVSYLELLKVPYTGCNPRGLILARDKALAKKILSYHRIKSPKFYVFPKNKKVKIPKNISYPLIVKCLFEEASYGISQASVVHNEEKLIERIQFLNQNLKADAIVEEFIEGKEYYVGIIGNYRLKNYPIWELQYKNVEKPEKEIYSQSAKWNIKYRRRKGIDHGEAKLSKEMEKKVVKVCQKAYKVLNLNGYARIDLRIRGEEVYILEANPNPNIALDDEFAKSAQKGGVDYKSLLNAIISQGLRWAKSD